MHLNDSCPQGIAGKNICVRNSERKIIERRAETEKEKTEKWLMSNTNSLPLKNNEFYQSSIYIRLEIWYFLDEEFYFILFF